MITREPTNVGWCYSCLASCYVSMCYADASITIGDGSNENKSVENGDLCHDEE